MAILSAIWEQVGPSAMPKMAQYDWFGQNIFLGEGNNAAPWGTCLH